VNYWLGGEPKAAKLSAWPESCALKPGGASGEPLEPAADTPAEGIGRQVAEAGMRDEANEKGKVHNYRTTPQPTLKVESAQAKAERTIADELKRRRWSRLQLEERAKSEPEKLSLAARLLRETTLTLPWIAARLHMGTWKSLNAKLHRWRRTHETRKA
jgi:hypothetical protein